MTMNSIESEVREVPLKFQDVYITRDKSKLDDFMQLFAPTDEIELIGVGASECGGREWFKGHFPRRRGSYPV